MTVQLELDFLSSYAYVSVSELRAFAVAASRSSFKSAYIFRYREMKQQALDLSSYAILNNCINFDEYVFLTDSIEQSSDIFWGN